MGIQTNGYRVDYTNIGTSENSISAWENPPVILNTLKYGSSVATCGLTGGIEVSTTVFP